MDLMKAASIAGAITAIAGTVALTGWSPPRPAWSNEFKALEIRVAGNTAAIVNSEMESLQRRLYQNRLQEEEIKSFNKPVPSWVLDDRAWIERRQKELQQELEAIKKSGD